MIINQHFTHLAFFAMVFIAGIYAVLLSIGLTPDRGINSLMACGGLLLMVFGGVNFCVTWGRSDSN